MKTKYNITEINPKSIKEIRQIIRDSLNVIFEDNNLVLDFGNATYDDDSVKFTNFKVRLATADDPKLKDLKNYLKYSEHDFDLDKILIDRNDQYKLVGFKPRSSKRPFIIENINTNKTYVCDEKMIVRLYREQS
jgi:hypothetical protein